MFWQQDFDGASTRTERSERSLVRRVLAGEASAFLDLVNRHHGSAVRIAVAWGHDDARAEEIARSAWCALLDRIAELDGDGDGAVRRSLLRIASDLARATAPERPRQRPGIAAFAVDGERHERAPAAMPPRVGGEVGPAALRRAIAELPAYERVVITLRDVERLAAEDAAAVLGVTVPVQHRLLHQARTSLLGLLYPTHDDGVGLEVDR
jgi:RNA polymerase sigma-70 factor, ECF subfamily